MISNLLIVKLYIHFRNKYEVFSIYAMFILLFIDSNSKPFHDKVKLSITYVKFTIIKKKKKVLDKKRGYSMTDLLENKYCLENSRENVFSS